MKPLLSVCIPTYNRCKSVKKCVDKWLSFDIPWVEVVIADNASSDKTRIYMESVNNERFHYFRNDSNIGYLNIFQCTQYAQGEFCLLVSDEDIPVVVDWDFLEKIFKCPGINLMIGRSVTGYYSYSKRRIIGDDSYEAYVSAFSIGYMSGIIYRKSVIDSLPIKELETLSSWRLYPQVAMAFFCVRCGGIYEGVYIDLVHEEDGFSDKTAQNDTSVEKPYFSIESRQRQHDDWVSLASTVEDTALREKVVYFLDRQEFSALIYHFRKQKDQERLRKDSRLKWILLVIKTYFSIISGNKKIIKKPYSKGDYLTYRVNMLRIQKDLMRNVWRGNI